jgi:hypothetical protein
MRKIETNSLERCKRRAREYLAQGDVTNAIASMGNMLRQREEYTGVVDKMLPLALFYAANHDIDGARRWIEGFR